MQINPTNHPYADKIAGRSQERVTRAADAPERKDPAARQLVRDAFVPSSPAENSGIYKPPVTAQAKSATETGADSTAELKTKPQIDEILAKIKEAMPDDLLNSHQKAALENIAALLDL